MTNHPCFHLFVYGSLRQGFNSPAYNYISKYFELVSQAKIKGRLYDLGNFPAGVPSSDDAFIIGELYHIKNDDEFDWAMAQLDDYEGLDETEEDKSTYNRSVTPAISADGSIHPAWVYWYTGSIEGRPIIESGDLLEYLSKR